MLWIGAGVPWVGQNYFWDYFCRYGKLAGVQHCSGWHYTYTWVGNPWYDLSKPAVRTKKIDWVLPKLDVCNVLDMNSLHPYTIKYKSRLLVLIKSTTEQVENFISLSILMTIY